MVAIKFITCGEALEARRIKDQLREEERSVLRVRLRTWFHLEAERLHDIKKRKDLLQQEVIRELTVENKRLKRELAQVRKELQAIPDKDYIPYVDTSHLFE